MAVFTWIQNVGPDQRCLTCMSQVNTRGFVDCISEVNVTRDGYGITGIVDVVLCATCLEQAAGQIGCVSPADAQEFAYKEQGLHDENEKLRGEVFAWQQRLMSLANFSVDDFKRLAIMEQQDAQPVVVKP